MLLNTLFFLVLGLCATFAEGTKSKPPIIDDVTTIYKMSYPQENVEIPVEIRARTNALGMSPFTEFGFLEAENKNSDILCWYPLTGGGSNKCNWTSSGFIWEFSEDSYQDYFSTSLLVRGCQDSRPNDISNRECHYYGGQYCRSSSSSYDQSCEVIFISDISKDYYYKIETKSRCRGDTCGITGIFHRCKLPPTGDYNFQSGSCSAETSFNLGKKQAPLLWIEMKDGKIQVWKGENKEQLLFTQNVGDGFGKESVKRIKTYNSPDLSPAEVCYFKMLQSVTSDSTLTSPKVTLSETDFCLWIMFYTGDTQDQDQLSVFAMDEINTQYLLGTFHSNQSGWYSWKLENTLPSYLQGKLVNIVVKTLKGNLIKIQRISSCIREAKEEVSVITSNMLSDVMGYNELNKSKEFPYKGGKAYHIYEEPKKIETASFLYERTNGKSSAGACYNQGVMTEAGCACPAGFAGPNCTHACGPNRFGHDCGGKCSIYDEECKGLLLCTPGAGCHCAPGYHGSLCNEECDTGSYGVDCSQSCGECWDREDIFQLSIPDCDKYSGHCSRCQPGFYPPYCTERYPYLKIAPLLRSNQYQTIAVSINFTKENMAGSGKAMFYQLQYKKKDNLTGIYDSAWQVYTTQRLPEDEGNVEVEMENMVDAAEYLVRVVLLADGYNSYQGNDVATGAVHTKCEIPDVYDYNIKVAAILMGHLQTLEVTWSYNIQHHWCPVVDYEFWWREDWQWRNKTVHLWPFKIENVLPNENIYFKVRARTIGGFAPFSETIKSPVVYDNKGTQTVENLRAIAVQHNIASISWDSPENLDHAEISYIVTYECTKRPSCSISCSSSGSYKTNDTTTSLGPLLPAARYEVSVSADLGPKVFIIVGTLESVPEETPMVSDKLSIRTNSSATVFWEPVEVCSGFFLIYHYQLTLASDASKTVESGKTRETSVTFNQLQASTDYSVCVSVETTGGWDPSKCLLINISTAATVPEQVANLTVYKRSRNMVGLRWSEPKALYGELESFTVSYSHQNAPSTSVSVKPKRCVPWPALYCHTVEGLKPAKLYNFTVKARNKEIHEDGAGAVVVGQTRESSPGAPENLTLINITSTSLGLQWEHPNLTNGVLRSFLISVEETEMYDQEQCCQLYPIIEIPVSEEQKSYQLEVTGLHPASMYTVSVAGKTIGFGPSQTLSASTRPPMTAFTPPEVELNQEVGEWKWMPQSRLPELNNSQIYANLVKSHILLILTNGSQVETGVEDEKLKLLLQEQISTPFYMAAEHEEGASVSVGAGHEGDSQWGFFSDPPLQSGLTYQMAAVQISEYNKVFNIDIILSDKFLAS